MKICIFIQQELHEDYGEENLANIGPRRLFQPHVKCTEKCTYRILVQILRGTKHVEWLLQ
jgi:hypothetical protein